VHGFFGVGRLLQYGSLFAKLIICKTEMFFIFFSECNLFLILKPILRHIVFGIVKNLVLVS